MICSTSQDYYVAGLSIDEIKQKFGVRRVIKLASNESPFGVSPLVQEEVKKYIPFIFRYPRVGSLDLVKRISEEFGLQESSVVIGNGSDELIDLLIRLRQKPDANIIMFYPGFSIYELQAKLCKLCVKKVSLNKDFSFSLSKLIQAIDPNTVIVFLTNPYNPSGYAVKKQEILDFIEKVPEEVLVVVDEAYIDFVDDISLFSIIDKVKAYPNLVVLRTFSKAYGLAGLRLGFGVMSYELAESLKKSKLPFSVNILAEKAGIAALKDKNFYELTVSTVKRERELMYRSLKQLGCKVLKSYANFLMFSPPVSSDYVYEELLKAGIIIRSLKSYNLPSHLRVSIGTPEENKIFLTTLEKIIKKGRR